MAHHFERIQNPDGSEIVQCYRDTLERILRRDVSAQLRRRIEALLVATRYNMIWVQPDGVTDAEFESHLEQVRREASPKPD